MVRVVGRRGKYNFPSDQKGFGNSQPPPPPPRTPLLGCLLISGSWERRGRLGRPYFIITGPGCLVVVTTFSFPVRATLTSDFQRSLPRGRDYLLLEGVGVGHFMFVIQFSPSSTLASQVARWMAQEERRESGRLFDCMKTS